MVLETILIIGGIIAIGVAGAWASAYKKRWRMKMEQKYPPTDGDGYSQLPHRSRKD